MERRVCTIFCDDIRLEAGNKQSYMGVYSGSLLVGAIPTRLQKLCVKVNISTPVENPFEKLIIRLLKDDQVIFEADMTAKVLEIPPAIPEEFKGNGGAQHALNAQAELVDYEITEPHILRVRIETESEELKGTGLMINVIGSQ